MKIKTKKQLNLPQLIEWAWENNVRGSVFRTPKDKRGVSYKVRFSEGGRFCSDDMLGSEMVFTVEVEEEITEDTKFRHIVFIDDCDLSASYVNRSVNEIKYGKDKEFHAYIDGEFKCIWRDGKLVD